MNELKIFESKEFGKIRELTIDGEPWFVGKDVAEALGYVKARNAIASHVEEDDKRGAPIQGDLGGTQSMTIINESGLYALIFGSKLESAKRFKHWVTSEVLPSIRRTGSYSMNNEDQLKLQLFNPDPLKVVQAHQQLTAIEIDKATAPLKLEIHDLKTENETMKPKTEFYDQVADTEDLIDFGSFADTLNIEYGIEIGRTRLFNYCRQKGFLCSTERLHNKPKHEMIQRGYMMYKTSMHKEKGKWKMTCTPYLTGRGQIWLAKHFVDDYNTGYRIINYKG